MTGSDAVTELTDVWTFQRDLKAADPTWKLVATRSRLSRLHDAASGRLAGRPGAAAAVPRRGWRALPGWAEEDAAAASRPSGELPGDAGAARRRCGDPARPGAPAARRGAARWAAACAEASRSGASTAAITRAIPRTPLPARLPATPGLLTGYYEPELSGRLAPERRIPRPRCAACRRIRRCRSPTAPRSRPGRWPGTRWNWPMPIPGRCLLPADPGLRPAAAAGWRAAAAGLCRAERPPLPRHRPRADRARRRCRARRCRCRRSAPGSAPRRRPRPRR